MFKIRDKPFMTININQPAIRIKMGRCMSINKKALYALSNPENILFWWSKSSRVLLISTTLKETPLSIKINECYYNTKSGLRIEKSKLIHTIMKITGWRTDMIYVIIGEYIAELDMIAFKVDNAIELED